MNTSYIISVSAGQGIYRHIRVGSDFNLLDLHWACADAYDFGDVKGPSFVPARQKQGERIKYSSNRTKTTLAMRDTLLKDTCLAGSGTLIYQTRQPKASFNCRRIKTLNEATDYSVVIKSSGSMFGSSYHARLDDLMPQFIAVADRLKAMTEINDLTDSMHDLLVDYVLGATNLFGIVPVSWLVQFVARHHPPVSQSAMCFLVLYISSYKDSRVAFTDRSGTIIDEDGYDLNQSYLAVDTSVIRGEAFEDLVEVQGNKPFYEPSPAELINYAHEEDYVEPSAYYDQFRAFMLIQGLKPGDADEFMKEIVYATRITDGHVELFLEIMERHHVTLKNNKAVKTFAKVTQNLINHTRLQSNRGRTPMESFSMHTHQKTAPPGVKTGRNQPCPCGSGKKHKHCCGKPGHLTLLPGKTPE